MPLVVSGFSLIEELELISKSGISNYKVLKATTINCALANHQEDILGSLEPKKYANILILNENPLECLSNIRLIYGVVLKGKYLSKLVLDEMLLKIKENACVAKM